MSTGPTTIALFTALIVVTLGITVWTSRRNTDTRQHYTASGDIKGWHNGLAISSDFLSASAFLGVGGAAALSGYTGFYLTANTMFAYILILFVIGEPMRNLGKYTMADALTTRFDAGAVRSVAALGTVVITVPYMIVQLVGAGVVIELVLGVDYSVAVTVIGILMALYVALGGMRAATWIQLLLAVVLIVTLFVTVLLVASTRGFNFLEILDQAAARMGSEAVTPPSDALTWVSLSITYMLGIAGLPHILIRFFTVPNAKAARSSVVVAIWVVAISLLAILFIGYGAALLVGQDTIAAAGEGGNLAIPLLAEELGGAIFLAIVSATVFAAILSTVVGMLVAASGAFGHDFYNKLIRGGKASDKEQLKAARVAAIAIPIVAIVLSLGVQNVNIAILVAVPLVVAASANVPPILLMLYWKKFNTAGLITGMLAGMVAAVGLVLIGPTVMGDDAIFPLGNPGLASVPIGFIASYLGTVVSRFRARSDTARERQDRQDSYTEVFVRLHTGIEAGGDREDDGEVSTVTRGVRQ